MITVGNNYLNSRSQADSNLKQGFISIVKAKINHVFGPDLLNKIKRKVNQNFERSFKFNSNFKPKGIYRTSKDYSRIAEKFGARVFEVYPNLISHLPLSQKLYNACAPYAKPKLTVKTDYVVVNIPNGRVYTNNMGSVAIISHDNRLIGDVSFQYKNGNIVEPKDNIIFSQNYFLPPLKLPGVVFSMLSGGGAINNYGHWLMDALPRLHLLKKSGLFDSVDWFLVPSLQYDYQRDSLKLLGIPFNKVIEGDKLRHVQGDFLIATTAPRGNEALIPNWAFQFIREKFLPAANKKNSFPSFIHISRRDSKFRNVLNEDELVDLITPYGFETITLSQLSFVEKINLFANADVILGASGAGLTNIFFCKPGAKLIELFSEGFVLTDYIDLAYQAEMEHYFVISDSLSEIKTKKQGQRDHMIVNLKKLKEVLDNALVTSSTNSNYFRQED